MSWTQIEAIELCREVEQVCPKFGCHVALTGGLLYGYGERKDCDLVFYRIRQQEMCVIELLEALSAIGIAVQNNFGFVIKTKYKGKPLDLLIPEINTKIATEEEYPHE